MHHVTTAIAVVLVLATACKKSSDADPAGSGSDSAMTAGAPPGATAQSKIGLKKERMDEGAIRPERAVPAPAMTPELLFKEGPTAFVTTASGVLLAVDAAPIQHLCRVELGTALVRLGKITEEAWALQADPEFVDPTNCDIQGSFTACTYRHPVADDGTPDQVATWVFVGDEAKPVLLAVLLGSAANKLDALAPELVARACK